MAEDYAELIGDPVAHSLSPAIHLYWLDRLGLASAYRSIRVATGELHSYVAARRADPRWLGCNVTMPLKQAAADAADRLDPSAAATGAVNCLVPRDGALVGHNTDLDGIAAALAGRNLAGRDALILGAGGGARAAAVALARRGARPIILARNEAQRDAVANLTGARADRLDAFPDHAGDAALLVNASPLGMTAATPPAILDALTALRPGALVFDMVYRPLETPLLARARAAGLDTVDGLVMLIGQARRAFELFYGAAPPPGDAELRTRLLRAD